MQSSDLNNQSSSMSCLKLSLGEIKRATNDFAKKNFVAKVHFGSVYRGKMEENSYCGEVAVKRLDKKSQDASLVLQKEIHVLTALPHTNITSLVGFCEEDDEKILVYEFMPNSSLYGYLFTRRKLAPRLTVEQRLEICLGVAKGLYYLHFGADLNIIHSELNTHKILLDASLVPKITGFEFCITRAAGTFSSPPITKNILGKENFAPECYEPNYKPTQKADVYAFGLLLLEVLCERQFWNRLLVLGLPFIMRGELPKFTPKHVQEEISPECARGSVKLIRDCLEFHPDKRPDMNQVVSELELALKLQTQPHDAHSQNINLQPNNQQFSVVNNECHSFPLTEIKRATNDFAISNRLGEGGFGDVYLGKISRSGNNVEVAVKRMSSNPEPGDHSFQREKKLLSACNHANIISLVGFCDEQYQKILVYEFMPNGSLFDHIYNHMKKGTPRLTVEKRLEICLGVAEGLSYLHSGKDFNIIHCDLKPDNILLDANLVPKISDFGLSRTRAPGSAQATKNIQGTDGYIAPECYEPNYKPSRKADVYAFGVILLEVLCERPGWARIVNSAFWFFSKGELPDFVPEHVKKNISPECSRACANLIKDCLEIDPNNRPSMTLVIASLEMALKLQKINPEDGQKNKSQANSQQRFSLSGIKTATNKFSPQNLLVETKFERVYRGNISMDVAVKRKKRKVDQDTHLFQNEIDFLSACHHANVISLVGYCDEPHDSVLVYEVVPNGSLYDRLHNKQDCNSLLTSKQRLDICLGVAKGLCYLHSSTQSNTIRSYLNSESILLDGNLVPKISNFEFPRNCAEEISTSQQFKKYKKDMKWYLAPECNQYNYINVSKKADVYALGVLFLEVLCAMPSQNGRDSRARRFVMEGELQRLIPEHVKTNVSQECLQTYESLIKDCLENDPHERLSINQVVDKLELALRLHMHEENHKSTGSI